MNALDLEKLAKRANQRLRQLEKDDAAKFSSAYHELKLRAYDRRAGMTITKTYTDKRTGEVRGGNIAFRRDFSRMSFEEMAELSEALESFFSYKTTTSKKALESYERSYETYTQKALEGEAGYSVMSREQYEALWTSSATKAFSYGKVLRIMKKTGATQEEIDSALAESIKEQEKLGEELSERKLTQRVEAYMRRKSEK